MQVQPSEAIYEPLKRGQSVNVLLEHSSAGDGTYRGTVWLHLNFTDKSTGEESRIAVSAQIIEIEAVDFFGLSVNCGADIRSDRLHRWRSRWFSIHWRTLLSFCSREEAKNNRPLNDMERRENI